jgi:mevalonate kinase
MSEILKVLNKKNIELKSEKLELATFADPETQVKRVEELNQEMNSYLNEINQAINKAKKPALKARDLADRALGELKSDLAEFTKKVKALGINPSELKQVKDYDKAIKRVDTLTKNINKSFDEIRKF